MKFGGGCAALPKCGGAGPRMRWNCTKQRIHCGHAVALAGNALQVFLHRLARVKIAITQQDIGRAGAALAPGLHGALGQLAQQHDV